MPSRTDTHQYRHDNCSTCVDPKPVVPGPPRPTYEGVNRRQRRTRFISGGITENDSESPDECPTHRTRRSSNAHYPRHSKSHVKFNPSLPSSPKSCPLTNPTCHNGTVVLDAFESHGDAPISRLDHEDDNSFGSSVFSEHLAQPELVIKSTSDDPEDSVKSHRSSILAANDLILSVDDHKETDQGSIAKDMKADVAGLLIHEDSGVSTPTLANADDAGSSEGEDDNDGKEPMLISSADIIHLPNDPPNNSKLVTTSETSDMTDPCVVSSCDFTAQGLALLSSGSFARIHSATSPDCAFDSHTIACNLQSRLIPESGAESSLLPIVEGMSVLRNNEDDRYPSTASPAVPADVISHSTPSRMLTRSQTAGWSRNNPAPSHSASTANCTQPNLFHSVVGLPPASESSALQSITHNITSLNEGAASKATENPSNMELSSDLTGPRSTFHNILSEKTQEPAVHLVNIDPRLDVDLSLGDSAPASQPRMEECVPEICETATAFGADRELNATGKMPIRSSATAVPRKTDVDYTFAAKVYGSADRNHSTLFPSRVPKISVESPQGNSGTGHEYPLRSRLRRESMRRQWQAAQSAPKEFGQLPTEVLFRITHYLSIQDVFRLQRVNHRFKAIVERYLLLVKRINFSNGLPFAFLSESINDLALKRILTRTPEVTHILGFYPRRIAGSYPSYCHSLGNNRTSSNTLLTYAGIVSAFRICPKLRSVELMDVELMSKLVHYLPRIKFHGMFRNRPDSWDCEYAVPLPPEPEPSLSASSEPKTASNEASAVASSCSMGNDRSSGNSEPPAQVMVGRYVSTLFCSVTATAAAISGHPKLRPYRSFNNLDLTRLAARCLQNTQPQNLHTPHLPLSRQQSDTNSPKATSSSHSSLFQASTRFAHKCALDFAGLSTWFEPLGEYPLGQGSPSTVPHFLPSRSLSGNGGYGPWYEYVNLSHIYHYMYNAGGSLDVLRNMVVAPFLQASLPPIEAELIAGGPSEHIVAPNYMADAAAAVNNHGPVMAFAFDAVFVSPHMLGHGLAAPVLLAPPAAAADGAVPVNQADGDRRIAALQQHARNLLLPLPHAARQQEPGAGDLPENPLARVQPVQPHPFIGRQHRRQPIGEVLRQSNPNNVHLNAHGPWLVSPLPNLSNWIALPHAVTNLTKLDLVSVAVSAIPRLDNIKYLHLKWVVFASADPFFNFSATKLQSFVMNNCSGPSRVVRFVRIFSALARAPQLVRLELVGTRFVDGLLGHIIDDALLPGRGFRNLQRLVLSSNRDATEVDVGLLLLTGQQSLNHVALQVAHTRNSLFESLSHAQASFPRLENLILGYQDPYQSRLTVSELLSLGIGESPDHLMPICGITDWGLSLVFRLCPRLNSVTIRHAPYLTSLNNWFTRTPDNNEVDESQEAQPPASSSSSSSSSQQQRVDDQLITEDPNNEQLPASCADLQSAPLRLLTLENCPGISVETLEDAISSGEPFPCLETLVLRDMFFARPQFGSSIIPPQPWNERMLRKVRTNNRTDFSAALEWNSSDILLSTMDWRVGSTLLALADLLSARCLGYSPLCSEGVGLATSVREITHLSQSAGMRHADLPVKSFEIFYSLRTHHYLNSLVELDGSCGPLSVERKRITGSFLSNPSAVCMRSPVQCVASRSGSCGSNTQSVEFVSQSTQTCVCGLLEWELFRRLSTVQSGASTSRPSSVNYSTQTTSTLPTALSSKISEHSTPSTFARSLACNAIQSTIHSGSQQQLGGPLSFHPFPPSLQHQELYKIVTGSDWTKQVIYSPALTSISSCHSNHISVDPGECPGCCSDPLPRTENNNSISSSQYESSQPQSEWIARDACVDTSELRCHTGHGPLIFTISQPMLTCYSNLTSVHFEKVGLSHLVLSGAPHLKNITLENCPQLQGILIHRNSSLTKDEATFDILPALRRIRIIRCPRFAIYSLLHSVASLYPAHDENVSITYRPFGHYEEQIERALWDHAHYAHVLVSHDYKQQESERSMEEFHSTFDQLFREVINFSDMLIRRELIASYPKPDAMHVIPSSFRRCEYGIGWNLVTDIPWIHEVCCSILKSGELHRPDQADQFYEVLSEIQAMPDGLKLQRRGIHLHIQHRDVHSVLVQNSNFIYPPATTSKDCSSFYPGLTTTSRSYHKWSYSEQYVASTHPANDLNAWDDGTDEVFAAMLPYSSCRRSTVSSTSYPPATGLSSWQRLLLSQEEAESEVEGELELMEIRKNASSGATNVTATRCRKRDRSGLFSSPKLILSGSSGPPTKRTRSEKDNFASSGVWMNLKSVSVEKSQAGVSTGAKRRSSNCTVSPASPVSKRSKLVSSKCSADTSSLSIR
ncbi:unnamed protein product [Calicophoron daubneyi]|uniref:F-box domain-containing protein n=1 Tax=Calicophoron daubneyi TaxID=300641 RepID=A0AAV2T3Q1_CALDB